MLGYLNNPEATARTVVDGWLHTGDIGYQDAQGNFFIVDRKKELIVLSTGKKVGTAPSPPSPPRLELSPLLLKTWEVVRSAEEAEGRMLAPLTGSTLEAQLLIHRVEVCVFVDEIGGWIV